MNSLQYVSTDRAGQIFTGPCKMAGIVVQDTGANTWSLSDDTTAGTAVFKLSQGAAGCISVMFPTPVSFGKGIYLDMTGTTGRAMVLLA